MKSIYFLLIFLLPVSLSAFSQRDGSVRGRLQDTAAHIPLPDATITVLNAKDSSLAGFSRSQSDGQFVVKGLGTGSYRLLVTHVGFQPAKREFVITAQLRDPDLGPVAMTDQSKTLDAVTVEVAPVTIRHDTIEYNAGSFKTKPDAVVEDLLKKLPGIQVDKDGNIQANGQKVKKVTVDGKEFFGNDPKIATKNLPAEAVDKVQVFNKKSDQSQFTGFDDGQSQQAINLTIKKDHKHGTFGKVSAGGGSDADRASTNSFRGDADLSLNHFNGDRQLSAIGMANNTNRQGFSFLDVLSFSPPTGGDNSGGPRNFQLSGLPIQGLTGNSQAITTTKAGGVNFNDSWPGSHTDIHGNYFFNQADDQNSKKESRQFLLPTNPYRQDELSNGASHNENQRLTFISDQKLDSFTSVKFSSAFTWQNSNRSSSVIDTSRQLLSDTLLNNAMSNSSSFSKGYNWSSNALFRHRFAKKGRTFSANLQFGLNNNTGGGDLYSVNKYYQQNTPSSIDTINQHYDLSGHGNNYGANLVYTEPLSRKSLLEFHYNFNQAHSTSDKKTFDADGTGKYTLADNRLTNDFANTYTSHQEGIQLRNQQRLFNFAIGATIQETASDNRFGYLTQDTTLHQSFVNFLPNANLTYNVNSYQNFNFRYNTSTNQPSTTQLAPVADNSDPLNIRAGNPALKQEYYHNLMFNFLSFDPFRHTSFFANVRANVVHNKIVNDDEVDSVGVRTTRPVNLDGLYNVNGSLSWGFPLRALKSRLNLNSNAGYDHNASLENGVRNTGSTWTLSQQIDWSYSYKDKLDVTGDAKVDYNDARYSLQPGQNQVYWTETYSLDVNWYGPHNFSIASDFNYIHRTGLPPGYNSSPFVWNAGLAKKVLKYQRGTIRLQVFDILKQNTGFSRNTSQNYIDDISYRVINRYWLLSFTYSLNRFTGGPKADVKFLR